MYRTTRVYGPEDFTALLAAITRHPAYSGVNASPEATEGLDDATQHEDATVVDLDAYRRRRLA